MYLFVHIPVSLVKSAIVIFCALYPLLHGPEKGLQYSQINKIKNKTYHDAVPTNSSRGRYVCRYRVNSSSGLIAAQLQVTCINQNRLTPLIADRAINEAIRYHFKHKETLIEALV